MVAIASIIISLTSLLFVVYNNYNNRRLSVLPVIKHEWVNWEGETDTISSANEDNSKYRIFVDKDGKLNDVEKWNYKHLNIMKDVLVFDGIELLSKSATPYSFKMKNIGKGIAVDFSIVINKERASIPKYIQEGEEFVLSVLVEDEQLTFDIILNFKDIYGKRYVEKIEFFKGRLSTDINLKPIFLSKYKTWHAKKKAKKKLTRNDQEQ